MTGALPDGVRVRPARADDLPACGEVWVAGLDDYAGRVGRPPLATPPATMLPLLEHLRATDPERFLVAVRDEAGGAERVVAFTSALRRADVWFLAMLFVRPREQDRGLGRRLLERVLPAPGDTARRATCTDAAQPISNALYARYGMVPRVPVLELVGYPDPGRLAPLPRGVRAVPFEVLGGASGNGRPPAWAQLSGGGAVGRGGIAGGPPGGSAGDFLAASLAALDRATLGYEHLQDHAFLAAAGRVGYLYTAGDGRAVAYGYAAPSGRLGPLAVEDEMLLPGVLGHLLREIRPAGAFAAWVPGSAGRAVTALLEAGLRLEDFPALLCWDRPFGDFARYVPITLAVL